MYLGITPRVGRQNLSFETAQQNYHQYQYNGALIDLLLPWLV